ncbi:hypothetical protein niasHT_015510 [Heterodera trifolii]|uniref:Nucleoside diphosphate kinase n=1 Tax=Heterodera trifolii TaxID=157864 RepID=A0ABD2L0B4_9BILA
MERQSLSQTARKRTVNPHSCQAGIQHIEHSLVIIKPESVRLQFSGRIIAAFEGAGLRKELMQSVPSDQCWARICHPPSWHHPS